MAGGEITVPVPRTNKDIKETLKVCSKLKHHHHPIVNKTPKYKTINYFDKANSNKTIKLGSWLNKVKRKQSKEKPLFFMLMPS